MADESIGAAAQRCGFVALLGAPNAGKSTLLNHFVGAKVSIVTPKPQTTRARVMGIAMAEPAQIVFIDTPGIFRPRRRLDRAMVHAAWRGARDADLVLLLIDAKRGIDGDVRTIVDGLKKAGSRALLALNKIDLIARTGLLELAATCEAMDLFDRIFMVSALTGDGVGDLRAHLADAMPLGPWHFPPDQLSDMPLRLLAAEITREQLFLRLHQELPYALAVETESWTEREDGSARVDQVIYIQREAHKPMVLGKKGQQIKAVGSAARAELEASLERRIHLFLHVKIRAGWADDPARFHDLGLEFNV